MRIESCLVGDHIEFLNHQGVTIATAPAPRRLDRLEGILVAHGVNPDDVARQAADIWKQMAYDLDFCFE